MKKRPSNNKRKRIKQGIIFLVFSMTIGFASISANLNILGKVSIASTLDNEFRLYFSRTYLNGVGKSNLINDSGNAFTFTYSDINHSNATIKYTVKNTSTSYYSDVEVSCKPRKKDGTTFLYDEDNYVSHKFRIEPGRSITKEVQLLLPVLAADATDNTSNLNGYVKSLSVGNDSYINFNSLNESGVFESTDTNSGNPVYYYRGSAQNNNVIFAEKCWKILRTTENGGVKLLYNGNPVGGTCLPLGAALSIDSTDEVIKFTADAIYNNNAYAGYMYGSLNAQDYESAHNNSSDSVFKEKIDKWYKNNILNTNYENYIMDDEFCNDRSILNDYSGVSTNYEFTTNGYGTHNTLYGSAGRVSAISKNLTPSFRCPQKNDNFSVNETENANGKLKYPIATLTADEIVYAGATNSSNSDMWLYTSGRSILTITPVGYYDGTMNYVILRGNGAVSTVPRSDEGLWILPTITLTPNIEIISGTGANDDPFILSSEDVYENSYTCSFNVDQVGTGEYGGSGNPLLDLQVGEEYCFGTECFYTISNDNKGTIRLMAKYNLYVGRIYDSANSYTTISSSDPLYGKQHYTAIGGPIGDGYPRVGTTVYSTNSNDNSYANSVPKPYVDAYGSYLRNLTGINIRASMVTKEDLLSLGCNQKADGSYTCANSDYDWVTGISYWTMSPGSSNRNIYIVGADGYFGATTGMNNDSLRGIRPVITVSLTAKNPDVEFVTGDGESTGDELCIGEECFYVLDYDGDNYTLFAKYNLYAGRIYTSSTKYTTISTSDPLYAKQNPEAVGDKNGYPRIGTMDYPSTLTVINDYVDYINNTFGMHVTGRPITYEELVDTIGCTPNYTSNHGCSPDENPNVKYDWVTNTTYWGPLQAEKKAYLVGGDGYFAAVAYTNVSGRGARPVIVVPVSDIKSNEFLGQESEKCPASWNDNGVFSDYYDKAYKKLKTMSTSEKVGQLLIMSYANSNPSDAENAIKNYNVGGVLFFANAFTGKTEAQVKTMVSGLQAKSKIPLITAVDEEGGTVVRISSNSNLAPEKFKSPQALYAIDGLNTIREDTITKSAVLKNLGINMNFAPDVDIADPGNFIYNRTLGQGPEETGNFAKTVVEASKGRGVGYSLKHFPGYGNNADTHTSSSVDETSLEELWNTHLVPFIAGIESGAEAVMISHNIVSALDKDYPSSLSKPVHDLLFNDLHFTGIAFTDDLYMEAIGNNYSQQYLKAFKAGNHVLLTSSSYATAHSEILAAVNSGEISMEELDKRVFKVLAWKYYRGVLK